jgi:hypothetical protein
LFALFPAQFMVQNGWNPGDLIEAESSVVDVSLAPFEPSSHALGSFATGPSVVSHNVVVLEIHLHVLQKGEHSVGICCFADAQLVAAMWR